MPPAGGTATDEPPAGPDGALRPRRDDLRGRHRAAVRLRPQAAPDRSSPSTARCSAADGTDADPARGPGARRRAAGARAASTSGDLHVTLDPDGRADVRGRGAGVGRRRAAAGDPGGRVPAAVRRHRRVLAVLARPARPTPGRWRETVQRSAITLKLMTYAPTGGAGRRADRGAARAGRRRAQLGLPLHLGARRVVLRLRAAAAGLHRGGRRVQRAGCGTGWPSRSGGEGGPLNIMYRVDGSSDLKEEILEHWEGYRGSRPVRIGNGAADQLQLDIYGEALDSIYFADQRGIADRPPRLDRDPRAPRLARRPLGPAGGGHLGDPRRAAGLHLRPADVLGRVRPRHPAGRRARPARRRASAGPRRGTRSTSRSWTKGWNAERQAFVQHYGSDVLDSSLLRMPTRRLHRTARPDVDLHAARRWTTSWSPTAWSTATTPARRPTACAARRARSRCARSCTSTRSPGPAGSTRPGWPSRRCSPTPTTSACTPRRSP